MTDKQNDYTLTEVMQNEYRDWALYTVEERAIPQLIDGLKPVQRMFLYSSIKNSWSDFRKVSAVAGVLSDYGYNHAETSGMGAGSLMAAPWNNNICLVEGRGNFGSRLVPEPGAPRYIYTRVHKNFSRYIKDLDLAPEHEDPEHEPPDHYIPVIPLVLANGATGIATGFSTNILPRDPDDLVACCKEWCETGAVKNQPRPLFPGFSGRVWFDGDRQSWITQGEVELNGKTTAVISEVPPGWTREKYVKHLDKLEENNEIGGYEDQCSQGFRFEVKLKRGTTWNREKLVKLFKLEKSMSENLSVVGPEGKLREYSDARKVIEDFCEYRTGILSRRIEKRLTEARDGLQWLENKLEFINRVLDDRVPFKTKKRDELVEMLCDPDSGIPDCPQENADRLLRIQIAGLSRDQVDELKSDIESQKKKVEYWVNTTESQEFKQDLEEIR